MATMAAVLNQEPAPLGEMVPGVSRELERIVTRCLRKDLARRSQSMAEIKIALEELKEEIGIGSLSERGRGQAACQTLALGSAGRGGGIRGRIALPPAARNANRDERSPAHFLSRVSG